MVNWRPTDKKQPLESISDCQNNGDARCMIKLSRCVLLVAVFVFTPRMCRAFSLYNAMAEIRELVICIFFTEKQAHESYDLWTVDGVLKGKGV